MKLGIDLIRLILLNIEENDGLKVDDILSFNYDFKTVALHVEVLAQAGYLDAKVHFANRHIPSAIGYAYMTWTGYDFLDAHKSDNVWARAKQATKKKH